MPRRRLDPLTVFGVPFIGGGVVIPAIGDTWYVDATNGKAGNVGYQSDKPLLTVQAAVDKASAGDLILIGPGEYDEDVVLATSGVTLIGAGPRGSVRITGTAAGTATALTIDGDTIQDEAYGRDIGIYNLNLEGRSGGSGLKVDGLIRRFVARGCKLHGGDQAVLLTAGSGGQIVDVRLEECVIANSAIGVSIAYSGGDPAHQILIDRCLFSKITADCVVEAGATHDLTITNSTFAASDGTEPTQFLDIDTAGTTGFVANNVFATTVFSTAKFGIASGVLFANNVSQAENPSANVGGTSGRPD